jgi:tyrosinase
MAETRLATRYETVKQILTTAAHGSKADYDGAGRFWERPLEELKQVRVYGIRMIAPAGTDSGPCCGGSKQKGEDPWPPFPGRGAASGLVTGLRGDPPFDGSKFPQLMWGGKAVSADDAQFISDWIDDGLPPDDTEIASLVLEGQISQPALAQVRPESAGAGDLVTHLKTVPANEYAYQKGELRQRMNLDCMSADQIEKLRLAMRELYALNKWPEDRRSYNNMALIHQNHCQHGWERFLPWHRVYLYEFEQALQDQCPDVTMAYWDWTMPSYMPSQPEKGWIIPPSFKAFLTQDSLERLVHAKPPLPRRAAAKIRKEMVAPDKLYSSLAAFFKDVADLTDAKFTKGRHRERFIDALLAANPLWYPLRYPAQYGKGQTINTAIHYHYPKPEDMQEILALRSFRDFGGGSLYNDSFGFLDQNPHNTMHIWTGGINPDYDADAPNPDAGVGVNRNRNRTVMVAGRRFHSRDDLYSQPQFGDMFSNLTASYDPVFWPIHANIDRTWHEWQQINPNSLPQDLDSVLTPWSYTIADTLDISRFGYEYVRSTCVLPVGLETPVGRFVSRPIEVSPTVRTFRQAEVRLHRVPQLVRSCFVRIFLNLPDANANTPLEDEHYAGYLAIFGHGDCYGGPDHCAIPPRQARPYDIRPRSHNTPRNHRVNVTKTARKLIDRGENALQITLVVIGADYQQDNDLLRLEGVSLNFLD